MKLFFRKISSGHPNKYDRQSVKKKRRVCVAAQVFVLCGLAAICLTACSAQAVCYKSMETTMGTFASQSIYTAAPRERAERMMQTFVSALDQLERETLSWRMADSELAHINSAAGGAPVTVSEKLQGILERCLQLQQTSGGAFDISIGRTARLWNIDSWAAGENPSDVFTLPEEQALRESLAHTGSGAVTIQGDTVTLSAGVQLDLGAVGKGVALDELARLAKEQDDLEAAVFSVGGSILTYGQKPDGTPWQVHIIDPFSPGQSIGYLTLDGEWYVSTSGNYERYVMVDGVRYHHILNPATGYPAESGLCSVTILAQNGLLSDGLSTACFVLGEEKGKALAETYGVMALFVTEQGEIVMTDNMKAYFHLSNG